MKHNFLLELLEKQEGGSLYIIGLSGGEFSQTLGKHLSIHPENNVLRYQEWKDTDPTLEDLSRGFWYVDINSKWLQYYVT